ncbi:MAG TPA: oxidoreductase, partial [Microlunatus sp.]|nr:oxidoreductase [Microlunatus sp.]
LAAQDEHAVVTGAGSSDGSHRLQCGITPEAWQLPVTRMEPGAAGRRLGVMTSKESGTNGEARRESGASGEPGAAAAGRWSFDGTTPVHRMGFGAMQLAGPGVMGPPADRDQALAVLRRAVELGVDHIDTSHLYGPQVVNELIREALHPYPDGLVLATKVGARRDEAGNWLPADSPDELRAQVHDNLEQLDVPTLDLVNLRVVTETQQPDDSSIAARFEVLAELREQGMIKHLGLSNAGVAQLAEALTIAPVAQVQNAFNIVYRDDAPMVARCAGTGIAYVPFFPLGSAFGRLPLDRLSGVAARNGATERQVALAWLLHRAPCVLLIPGTASVAHLEQNVAAAGLTLTDQDRAELDAVGAPAAR